jgi:hypothetical protein
MIMGKNVKSQSLAILTGLLLAAGAAAHPYDEPLQFRLHTNDDGSPVYSNIPKKCFRDHRLICIGLHPVFPTPVSTLPAKHAAGE